MVESKIPDRQVFRSVAIGQSASLLTNNLASNGTAFVTIKNIDRGGIVSLYGPEVLDVKREKLDALSTRADAGGDSLKIDFIVLKD
jgi:hypothetical protein